MKKEPTDSTIEIRLTAIDEASARAAAEQITVALADDATVTFYTLVELKAGWRFEGIIRPKQTATPVKSSHLTIDYEALKRFVKIVDEQDATRTVSVRIPKILADHLAKWVFRTSLRRKVTREKVLGLALALFFATHPLPPDAEDF